MRRAVSLSLLLTVLLIASGTAGAQTGLSHERAGLGLKSTTPERADAAPGNEAANVWQRRASDYTLYGGARDVPLTGLRPAESYAGIVHPLAGDLGVSLEGGYVPETPLSPRRYALSGQVHTALRNGQVLSVGLKYRVYDADAAFRNGMDSPIGAGYTLAPYRVPGMAPASSYQLQFSYQYNSSGTLGLALGRDLETYTPYFDLPGNGPRQFTLTGRYSLTPSWALSYDLLSQDVMSPLKVQGLRLGVRYRF
jgi:hypothetical protein